MFFGAHISAARGLHNAPANSVAIGGEVFQFFSRPPQGGAASSLSDEAAEKFRQAMRKHRQKAAYIHAPYYINLASTNNRIRYGSISVLREELERGTLLGVKAVMTHLGSANDLAKSGMSKEKAEKEGLKMVVEGIGKILDGYTGSCQLLIEISAGAGLVIGDTFDEIAMIITGVESKKLKAISYKLAPRLGVCFDIQHAFVSGYDMREPPSRPESLLTSHLRKGEEGWGSVRDVNVGVDHVINLFDKTIGLDRLVVFHCNDSKVDFGSHVDRHADLGDGHIGLAAFEAIVKNKKLQRADLILETPTEEKRARDVAALKKFRDC